MNAIAQRYVRLVLAVGVHHPGDVDAYYGPAEWKEQVDAEKIPLSEVARRITRVQADLGAMPVPVDDMDALRRTFLTRQLEALAARVRMLLGERLSFDDESQALYDAVAPRRSEEHFREAMSRLDALLPGDGPVFERYQAWRDGFIIPRGRLDAVFRAAVDACRETTKRHIELPAGESFTIEYVKDKPWSAYNWYQGNLRSVIQVNTSLPIFADRALDLACHEGYPGHHVYNMMLEHHLVRGRGWLEFTVYPLFSPMSLIAEGSANYGIEIAFPGPERAAFERDVVFPAAGINPARVEEFDAVQEAVRVLDHAGNEAARRYLDGEIDAAAAARWLQQYALMSAASAAQRVRFFDTYRSYVINYNLGRDLVRDHVERQAGSGSGKAAEEAAREAARWDAFIRLLASPRLPSGLR
jgi:hypothetical protein